ncbi:hypothetical protein GEV33_013844 [Tenebrio molitor]|uniref:Uncharacterized protein n=1 Tax=Tenebrio molitor TaxID=7067 RepID=A0A8J6H6U5_TENMO|nr:hypothetical protein GEV33_013844 [Tenebrio molitor]
MSETSIAEKWRYQRCFSFKIFQMTISNLQTRSFLYGRLDETNRLEDTEDVKVKISESDIRRTSEFRAVPRRHHITPHRAPSEAASVRSESAPVTHPRYPGALISAGSTQRPLVTHNNVVQEDVVQVKHPLFIATTRSNSGMRPLERASLRQTARPVNRRRVNGTISQIEPNVPYHSHVLHTEFFTRPSPISLSSRLGAARTPPPPLTDPRQVIELVMSRVVKCPIRFDNGYTNQITRDYKHAEATLVLFVSVRTGSSAEDRMTHTSITTSWEARGTLK